MSKKTEVLMARGNDKPTLKINKLFGQRNGKAQEAALYEVYDEMSVDPPATKQEVEAFLRLHIKRCRVNLANAKDRGDNKAKAHLERKLAVYEYLQKLVYLQGLSVESVKAMRECPNCRVISVDIFGLCHCCGKTF